MPFSFFAEYKPFKECFTFLKSIGWSWLLFTPLLFMNVTLPDHERRHTITRFIVQVVAALTITLVATSFAFYVGMRVFTAEINVKIKTIQDSLTSIEKTLSKQTDINTKNDLEFITHKHNRKDGAVKLRGE